MDESTKQFLELMRESLSKDHGEVKRRLEVIEQNQKEFQAVVALKADLDVLHQRVKDAKEDFKEEINEKEKRISNLEKSEAGMKGSLRATKVWGAIFMGVLGLAEVVGVFLALYYKMN